MEILTLSDVPPLLEIIDRLFAQKSGQDKHSCDVQDDTVHYSNRRTGEFIIYTVKTDPSGIYIFELAEKKNGVGCCRFSIYQADLERKTTETVWVSRDFFDEEGISARAKVSKLTHELKHCLNLEKEIYGPLFAMRMR